MHSSAPERRRVLDDHHERGVRFGLAVPAGAVVAVAHDPLEAVLAV